MAGRVFIMIHRSPMSGLALDVADVELHLFIKVNAVAVADFKGPATALADLPEARNAGHCQKTTAVLHTE